MHSIPINYMTYQNTIPISSSLVIFEGEWVFIPSLSFGQGTSSSISSDPSDATAESGKSSPSTSPTNSGSRVARSSKSTLVTRQSSNGQSTREGTVVAQITFDPGANVTIPFTGKSVWSDQMSVIIFSSYAGPAIQVLGIYPNGTDLVSADYTVGNNISTRIVPGISTGVSLGNQVLFEVFGLADGANEVIIDNIKATQTRQYTITGFNQFKLAPAVLSSPHKKNHDTGIIAGVTFGVLAFLSMIVFGAFYVRRQRKRQLHPHLQPPVAPERVPLPSGTWMLHLS